MAVYQRHRADLDRERRRNAYGPLAAACAKVAEAQRAVAALQRGHFGSDPRIVHAAHALQDTFENVFNTAWEEADDHCETDELEALYRDEGGVL
jgi:hypothetical protein